MFYLLPSIAHQSYLDLKVDLGLLFILLTIVVLLVEWQNRLLSATDFTSVSRGYMILIGLMIKLTAVMVFFAVASVIWYMYNGKIAFLAVFCMTMFSILLFRLDDMPNLRQFHLNVETFMWIMFGAGLLLFGWTALKERHNFTRSFKLSVLYTTFFILPIAPSIAPWLTKNYIETGGQLSVRGLMYGKTRAPDGNLNQFQKKWEDAYQKPKRKKNKKKKKGQKKKK